MESTTTVLIMTSHDQVWAGRGRLSRHKRRMQRKTVQCWVGALAAGADFGHNVFRYGGASFAGAACMHDVQCSLGQAGLGSSFASGSQATIRPNKQCQMLDLGHLTKSRTTV